MPYVSINSDFIVKGEQFSTHTADPCSIVQVHAIMGAEPVLTTKLHSVIGGWGQLPSLPFPSALMCAVCFPTPS